MDRVTTPSHNSLIRCITEPIRYRSRRSQRELFAESTHKRTLKTIRPYFAGWFDILSLSMAFQPMPVSRRSLRKQIAHVLEHPLGMVKKFWKKEGGTGTQPPAMEAYTEAANKCINSATAFMKHARLFVEAKRAYDLWQKEIELGRVRKEIDALKLVIPLLVEPAAACQIEYVSVGSYVSMPCGKPAVAQCAECGAAICSDCRTWCCGESFCEACRDCHVTNSCVKKPVERAIPFPHRSMPTRQA
jgi:hypothetical protein